MLDGLRNFAKSGPGKVLGAFLLVGVAGFGINNVILDLGNNTLARVGDEDITTQQFQRAYSAELNRFAQQYGSFPTAQEAQSMGLPTSVLQRLSQNAAIDGMAHEFGLGVTDERLARLLREDPNFAGTLGTFDAARFQQVLQSSGLTEAEYFADQSDVAARQQLINALFGEAAMTDTAADLLSRYIGNRRTVDYFVINATSIPTPAEPTEEQLAAYLEENQADFRTVETRSVDVLAFSPETLAQTIEVSEEEIAAEYEERQASLTTPERRTIEQVTLNSEELVAAFQAGLDAGTSFATLVETAGLTPSSLGTQSQEEITDQALAEAAFALDEGEFAIIEGIGGQRAIHVSAVEEGGETSLEEARETIAQDLALAEARNSYIEILDQIEELRAAFQPLTEIGERFGLEVASIDVTAAGGELADVPGLPEGSQQEVAQAIFAAEEDRLTAPVVIGSNQHVFFDLQGIEPARDQTLEEARDAVAAAWMEQQVATAVAERAEEISARLDEGAALADVAIEYNQFPQVSSPFTRTGEEGTPIDRAVANEVFAGGPDHHGTVVNEAGEHLVFEVVNVTPDEDGLDEATRQALAGETQLGLYSAFVAGALDNAGLRINQQALDEVLALGTVQ